MVIPAIVFMFQCLRDRRIETREDHKIEDSQELTTRKSLKGHCEYCGGLLCSICGKCHRDIMRNK